MERETLISIANELLQPVYEALKPHYHVELHTNSLMPDYPFYVNVDVKEYNFRICVVPERGVYVVTKFKPTPIAFPSEFEITDEAPSKILEYVEHRSRR